VTVDNLYSWDSPIALIFLIYQSFGISIPIGSYFIPVGTVTNQGEPQHSRLSFACIKNHLKDWMKHPNRQHENLFLCFCNIDYITEHSGRVQFPYGMVASG
jgi:hypothetical protein